jgi:hypothetical protein
MQPKPLIRNNESTQVDARHLCDTCLYAEGCCLQADLMDRVHHCEEYDDGSREAALQPPPLVSIPEQGPEKAPHGEEPLAGLCANCELRAECTLPKAPGGVWFCEEYR